jgi:flavin-dependent dehydrogenase
VSRASPIVIAGGGPGGAAAAIELARRGRSVLLADESRGASFRVGEALPPPARPLLRDLGVLDRFLADGHLACYGNVSSWGSDATQETDFLFNPHGHGWHLDRPRFDAMLRDAARDAGAEVHPGVRLTTVRREGDEGWRVVLHRDSGVLTELDCGWLVDATGRRGAVARRAGLTRLRDDRLVAFHARFQRAAGLGADGDSRTMIEAGPDGWWYAALIPSGECVVAFLTDLDLVDRASLLTSPGFLARVEGSRLVRARLAAHSSAMIGPPRVTDAGSGRLDQFAGSHWIAVGDAALSFDPLSSQGILNALYTGKRAGQTIDRVLSGEGGALGEYRHRLEGIHRAYRQNLLAYYSLESRWPERLFWSRRRNR